MGHKNLFAFEEKYDPAAGNNAIDRFLCGTNPIIASTALQVSKSLERGAFSSICHNQLIFSNTGLDYQIAKCPTWGREGKGGLPGGQ